MVAVMAFADKFSNKADADKALGSNKDKMEENKKIVIGAMMKCIDNEAYKKAVEAE